MRQRTRQKVQWLICSYIVAFAEVIQYDITVSQKHNKKLYYTCILYNVWKQLHVSAFFLGHYQVVLTSLKNAVHGVEAVTVMMRSHASYNISC